MDHSLFKHVRRPGGVSLAGWAVVLGVIWVGMIGRHRGLWLDEAWVANSVRSGSLAEMFWGGEWLQTSPPGFLLIARGWIAVFGLSTESLRAIPLLFAVVCALFVQRAAARLGVGGLGPLVGAATIFLGTGLEYFGAFKQFGAEAAAASVVLWAVAAELGTGAVGLLVAAAMCVGYSIVFLVPGVLLWAWKKRGTREALGLALLWGIAGGLLYLGFIRPNTAASLWTYWKGSASAVSLGSVTWVAASVALSGYAAYRRDFVMLACALPSVLLAVAEGFGWYPASPRTRLFVRPGFLLSSAMTLRPFVQRQAVAVLASGAAVVLSGVSVWRFAPEPFEDYPAMFRTLRSRVQADDLVLVHADARQGWLLYSAIERWDRELKFGHTGWPCCARGREVKRSSEDAVRADLERLVPPRYRGRVWLVYANRPLHWEFIGLDEGDLWRRTLWDRGCPPADYEDLGNIVVAPMDCSGR